MFSRCLSATGIRFLGIPSRPGIAPPLRSAYRAATSGADPDRVSMFRTRETRLAQGALFTPGTAVSTRPVILPGRRLPHHNGQPLPPGPQPAPGRIGDEASARVHCYSPHTSLPLACGPRRNRAPGLFPELRTRPGRTRQRTPERGQAWTLPGLRRWHQTSLLSTHSLTTCDLTSHERPNLRATTGDRRGVTPNSASPSAPPIRTGAAAGQQGSTTPGQRPRSSRSTRSARTSRRATRSFPRQRDAQRCGLHRLCDLRP